MCLTKNSTIQIKELYRTTSRKYKHITLVHCSVLPSWYFQHVYEKQGCAIKTIIQFSTQDISPNSQQYNRILYSQDILPLYAIIELEL